MNLKRQADEFLGEKETGLLEEMVSLLEKREKYSLRENQRLLGALEGLQEQVKEGDASTTDALADLEAEIRNIKIPDEVKVKNQIEVPDPPTTVSIDNFPEVEKYPTTIYTKEPRWLGKYVTRLTEAVRALGRVKQKVTLDHRTANNPVSVRLSDGRKFYNALMAVSTGGQYRQVKIEETAPTDNSKNNESFALGFDANDNLNQIDMTIAGTTYRRTITWTANNPTAISDWSIV